MNHFARSLQIAQRQHDALLAGPPEDWRDDVWSRASDMSLTELISWQHTASDYDDGPLYNLLDDIIEERPSPEDIDLYVRPDGENLAVLFNDRTGQDLSVWPLWLPAVLPHLTPAAALAAAGRALRDLQDHLLYEYLP